MSTAMIEGLAANPTHEDCFFTTPPDKGALEKLINDNHCVCLGWNWMIHVSCNVRKWMHCYTSILLYTVFLVIKLQSSLPPCCDQLLNWPNSLKPQTSHQKILPEVTLSYPFIDVKFGLGRVGFQSLPKYICYFFLRRFWARGPDPNITGKGSLHD